MTIDSLHLEYTCCASHLLHQWTFPSVWAEVDWAEAVTILGYLCICVTVVVAGQAWDNNAYAFPTYHEIHTNTFRP